MKKHTIFALSLVLIASAINAAPKAKKPKNFAEIFGKTWLIEKAFGGKKDMTEDYTKGKMLGVQHAYTFSEDGAMTTNEPDVISADWKFDDKGFQIHNKLKVPDNVPAGQGYAQDVTIIWNVSIKKDTLTLDQPKLKMKLIFKAQ